jgi:sphinganine C4-monooxygenase
MAAVAAAFQQLSAHCQTVASERLRLGNWELWLSLLPVVCYWVVAGWFELLDHLQLPAVERYRIHSAAEQAARNHTSRSHVFWRVILQHVIQTVVGLVMTFVDPGFCDDHPWRGWARAVPDFVLAMLVFDSWQYLIHRLMHESKVLYNAIHSHHHRLIVCYAFGALYNHPLEALLLDTMGGILTFYVTNVSCQTAVTFFAFASVKTVLDHSGYRFPVNLLHGAFPNNAAYHDVHHDPRGFRKNYSQPFFSHWDWLLGTYMAPGELKPLKAYQQQPAAAAANGAAAAVADDGADAAGGGKKQQ